MNSKCLFSFIIWEKCSAVPFGFSTQSPPHEEKIKDKENKNVNHSESFFLYSSILHVRLCFLFVKIGFIVGNFPDAMNNRTPDVHC